MISCKRRRILQVWVLHNTLLADLRDLKQAGRVGASKRSGSAHKHNIGPEVLQLSMLAPFALVRSKRELHCPGIAQTLESTVGKKIAVVLVQLMVSYFG